MFQLDQGDMFRVQERLLTPSELGDRSSGTWGHLENPGSSIAAEGTWHPLNVNFRGVPKFQMTYLRAHIYSS